MAMFWLSGRAPRPWLWALGGALVLTLSSLGAILDRRAWAKGLESARLGLLAAAACVLSLSWTAGLSP
jgi:hypothetical protein